MPLQDLELFRFAYFPSYFERIEYLVSLSDKENEHWGFKNKGLINYLNYTFLRLQEENKLVVTKDKTKCAFNTGLLTPYPYYEPIYAIFIRNTNSKAQSEWISAGKEGFCSHSVGYVREYCDNNFPKRARYFDDYSKLVFNPTKRITTHYEHIIKENKERLPAPLNTMSEDEIIEKFDGAIKIMNKRISLDYKLAVPQYYRNQIQLLLPLWITKGVTEPDLALVVEEKTNDYAATTCLTMSMAYNNARLIAKPHSNWLKPL